MMPYKRYQLETQILQSKGVPFRFFDLDTNLPYVIIAAKTNIGTIYSLRMDLDDFPFKKPFVSTTKMLYTKSGRPMNETVEELMCTIDNSEFYDNQNILLLDAYHEQDIEKLLEVSFMKMIALVLYHRGILSLQHIKDLIVIMIVKRERKLL